MTAIMKKEYVRPCISAAEIELAPFMSASGQEDTGSGNISIGGSTDKEGPLLERSSLWESDGE